jgi:hypothetical protein
MLIAATLNLRAERPTIPKDVQEVTANLIRRAIGTNEVKSIPLLDPAVDWTLFSHWPERFSYGGQEYVLRLTDTSGGDVWHDVKARVELEAGKSFLARYATGTNSFPPLVAGASWSGNGALTSTALFVDRKVVYTHAFAPAGWLYLFDHNDPNSGSEFREYFDRSGALVGRDNWIDSKERCEWDGGIVAPEVFRLKLEDFLKRL